MSEATATAAAPEQKEAKKVEGKKAAPRPVTKHTKVPWTLQRCKKAARRFHSEEEWRLGAPSSYKSATAHGWATECIAQYKGQLSEVGKPTSKKAGKTRAKASKKKTTAKKRTKKAA